MPLQSYSYNNLVNLSCGKFFLYIFICYLVNISFIDLNNFIQYLSRKQQLYGISLSLTSAVLHISIECAGWISSFNYF